MKLARIVLAFAIIGVLGLALSLLPTLVRSPVRRSASARPIVVRAGHDAPPAAARTRPVAPLPRALHVTPARAGDEREEANPFEGVPELRELDAIHTGLAAALRSARGEARGGLNRAARRCTLLLPDEPFDLEWDSIETFEPDGAGGAVLVGQELHPVAGGADSFYRCLADATIGQTRVVLPDGYDGSFQVRGGGRKILDPELEPDEVHREVAALRERLANPRLSDDLRAVLADHLALWECYADRGPAGRRDCLAASSQ